MAHVLVGYGEALPIAEVIFSLLHAGHEVSVFARTDGHPARRLPIRSWWRVTAPEADAAAAAADLRRVAADLAPDVVLPLDDPGLWALDEALGTALPSAGATGTLASAALDKSIQIATAREYGLSVPETRVVRRARDIEAPLTLPAIAKPALAVRIEEGRLTKGGARYLQRAEDLTNLRGDWRSREGPLLIQPLLAGTGEGLFGFALADGVVAWSAHRRLRMMNPHGSGSSACEAIRPDPVLMEVTSRFVGALGWRGPFMVELLRDAEGVAWFMELNGRMWGSMALARRQGLEYPAWAVAAALEPAFAPNLSAVADDPVTVRNLGRDILHLLYVLRGPRSDFHRAAWPRWWGSARAVLTPSPAQTFYNYDPDFPLYFLREAAWTIRRAIGG